MFTDFGREWYTPVVRVGRPFRCDTLWLLMLLPAHTAVSRFIQTGVFSRHCLLPMDFQFFAICSVRASLFLSARGFFNTEGKSLDNAHPGMNLVSFSLVSQAVSVTKPSFPSLCSFHEPADRGRALRVHQQQLHRALAGRRRRGKRVMRELHRGESLRILGRGESWPS